MMTGASAPESNAARKTSVSSGTAPGVVLIGFMGVGKSHVGKALARLLHLPFVDTDELIERQFGPIAAIFAQRGEKGFRLLEGPLVAAALAAMDDKPCVVALGGGAVTGDDVRAALTRQARVAWLTAPLEVVRARVRAGKWRPSRRCRCDLHIGRPHRLRPRARQSRHQGRAPLARRWNHRLGNNSGSAQKA